ncbi:MAG: hypothetical protein KF802_10985 [Bdellovibrionaceae bacterium]|nr:hypothetical protein [Pseudobdellovibrionaceae bacterium]MBX3032639.1 hypothetical protein [Pseudobdellovibrionaceae bacterium]
MNNDDGHSSSLVQTLKNEWSLLWESIAGEGDETPNAREVFEQGPLKILSLEDIRHLTLELSQGRKRLNQRLESLGKEIEWNSAKLESLRLVGGEDTDTVQKIHELNDQGQRISQELAKLDQILRTTREQEDSLRGQLTTA